MKKTKKIKKLIVMLLTLIMAMSAIPITASAFTEDDILDPDTLCDFWDFSCTQATTGETVEKHLGVLAVYEDSGHTVQCMLCAAVEMGPHELMYTSNGDGTHTASCYCTYEKPESCSGDETCDYCGASLSTVGETTTETETTTEPETTAEPDTSTTTADTEGSENECEHSWQITESKVYCTEVVATYVCTICGEEKSEVTDEGDYHSYQIFESNGDGTHTSYCYRCGLEGSTYDCADYDGEGYCGACGYELSTTTAATTASDSDDTTDSTSDTTASTATVTSVEIPDTGANEAETDSAILYVLAACAAVALVALLAVAVRAKKKSRA